MPTAEESKLKFLLEYLEELNALEVDIKELVELGAEEMQEAISEIIKVTKKLDGKTQALARSMLRDIAGVEGTVPASIQARIASKLTKALEEVTQQIQKTAVRMVQLGKGDSIQRTIKEVEREITGVQLKGKLRRRVEKIMVKGGGKTKLKQKLMSALPKEVVIHGRHYPREWYATLVAHNSARELEKEAVLWSAERTGNDLVIVSPNFSKINDFCNAYKGKVFSISGETKGVVPLSKLPNGGPPFHPFCWHRINVLHREPTAAELKVDKKYLLKSDKDSMARIASDWADTHKVLSKSPYKLGRHKTGIAA